ncbi:MAG: DUF2325 domain-containing protein [Clostridiales bacterium]|nr:DUF2325 domain-containing protein [Clostridiales bacterium]
MSVVILGGNECMKHQYESICKDHGWKAKVFPKESGGCRKKLGTPDLMILFTNTVSHKMVVSAMQEARRKEIPVARIHTSSACALQTILKEETARYLSGQ